MASITDYFGQTGSATAPAPITTVKTARLVGETVLAYNSVPGFQENTPVFFVTYKKVTDPVTGEISAVNQTSGKALANTTSNTLTNIVIAPGYTDIGNAVGDFIEVIPTSYWADSLVTGLAVSLNPNGTLKTGAVTSTAIAAGAVTNAAIGTNAVKASNIDFTTFPKFSAYNNGGYTLGAGTLTQITFPTVEYNILSGYSSGTSKFTAPIAGVYAFTSAVDVASTSTNTLYIALFKNGTEFKRSTRFVTSSDAVILLQVDVQLSIGDIVHIAVYSSATVPSGGIGSATYFSGHLIP